MVAPLAVTDRLPSVHNIPSFSAGPITACADKAVARFGCAPQLSFLQIVATGLGLQLLQLSSSTSAAGQQQQQQLLVVSFVVQDSPAAAAGIQEGDVLLTADGQPVAGLDLRWVMLMCWLGWVDSVPHANVHGALA